MLLLVLIASCAVLIGSLALARGDKESPPNTIDCAAFKKTPNGNWYVGPQTTFDIGPFKAIRLGNYKLSVRNLMAQPMRDLNWQR